MLDCDRLEPENTQILQLGNMSSSIWVWNADHSTQVEQTKELKFNTSGKHSMKSLEFILHLPQPFQAKLKNNNK